MIVWIASYPRSGNSFTREVLFHYYGVRSGSVYPEGLGIEPSREGMLLDPSTKLAEYQQLPEWHGIKIHDLPRGDSFPAIYIVRDGRDATVSYTWYILRKLERIEGPISARAFERRMKTLIKEARSPFGTWMQNVRAWSLRPATAVIRFEELVKDPVLCLEAAARTIGLPLTPRKGAKVPTFEFLREDSPTFYRRGVIGSWRDEMPPKMRDLFWKLNESVMKAWGYSKDG
ncbi:MAG: sulfotransferase domain-containing protein [Planctomycetes bacterium]|nr:sulfotransferase domain-containing protein [Planctomycetota bacterium]